MAERASDHEGTGRGPPYSFRLPGALRLGMRRRGCYQSDRALSKTQQGLVSRTLALEALHLLPQNLEFGPGTCRSSAGFRLAGDDQRFDRTSLDHVIARQ